MPGKTTHVYLATSAERYAVAAALREYASLCGAVASVRLGSAAAGPGGGDVDAVFLTALADKIDPKHKGQTNVTPRAEAVKWLLESNDKAEAAAVAAQRERDEWRDEAERRQVELDRRAQKIADLEAAAAAPAPAPDPDSEAVFAEVERRHALNAETEVPPLPEPEGEPPQPEPVEDEPQPA